MNGRVGMFDATIANHHIKQLQVMAAATLQADVYDNPVVDEMGADISHPPSLASLGRINYGGESRQTYTRARHQLGEI